MPTNKPHNDDVYRPKRAPKNPIKFHIQLNPEQKVAKQTQEVNKNENKNTRPRS